MKSNKGEIKYIKKVSLYIGSRNSDPVTKEEILKMRSEYNSRRKTK